MSFSRLKSRLNKRLDNHKDYRDPNLFDDQFYDICDGDSESGSREEDDAARSSFTSQTERKVFEEQLTQLQDQLVSITIQNQNLADELKLYKGTDALTMEEVSNIRRRNIDLEEQLRLRDADGSGIRRRNIPGSNRSVLTEYAINDLNAPGQQIPQTSPTGQKPAGRFERLWEQSVDTLYDIVDDLSDMTQPIKVVEAPVQPLSVKTLKENLRRFKTAVKPYMDTVKGVQNVLMWQYRSYTLIVFLVFMTICWYGSFLPVVFFLAALRMAVSYLHFKGFIFKFDYFPVSDEEEVEDELGLSEKFNLVIQVATKVQNGLGSLTDSLEKIKNLMSWRHAAGSRKVLSMLCVGCIASAIIPSSIFWKCLGVMLGVKLFLVNKLYNKYPRMKERWDSNYKLWQSLPTDAEYDRLYVRAEMDKYIMIPSVEGDLEKEVDDLGSDSDLDREVDSDTEELRQLFSLPVSESPLKGWSSGKRAVLIGKDRSLVTLLSKKRGKLYLTNSFLCFAREKSPSVRNIVIPLLDIVSIDKIKINQRFPGKGMAIQLILHSDGKDALLQFGGIIGREGLVTSIEEAVRCIKRDGHIQPSAGRRSLSSDSSSSRIQNFTFGAYYEDSE